MGVDQGTIVNSAQVEAWNGDDGQHWVGHRERYEAMLRDVTARMLAAAAIEPGDVVLDIGCGCGGTTRAAAGVASAGRVLGVDLSEPMLAEARRQAERAGMANVEFARVDAQVAAFPSASFDVAVSRNGVMFFDDPHAAFANVARALRPGGRLAFVCWQEPARSELFTLPLGVLATHLPLPALGGDGPGGFSLADPARIRTLLTDAGFGDVIIDPVVATMRIGRDVDDVVAFLRSVPLARSVLTSADETTSATITAALRDALAPHQSSDGLYLDGAAWLVTACRANGSEAHR